ncbi:alkaline phytoceramidase [Microthyrium microscopicum]|uniref:Alkaline phytoceramidase n=1 Tax=Microthyrium microscopicum TaxID=703497 RepID=A0A6A6U7C7_9PEZI|nr:alkaline phytoceramidase [Microthyrium microscopicum]
MRLSIPYPAPKVGYWEPVTATLNWCEEDYYATKYSAEIVNTITNFMFMYLAYRGISNCLRNQHPTVFLVSFFGYLVVGCGSFAFHSTLKYPMQLVDELSMIYTTCIMFYASFARGRSFIFSFLLSISLASLALFITGYYHYLQDPVFHQNAYGILTAIVVFRSVYVMESGLRPQWKAKERELRLLSGFSNGHADTAHEDANGLKKNLSKEEIEELKRCDDRDIKILKTMWTMIAFGLSSFLGGFALWNIDNIFCNQLRQWRRDIGLPWGILLEGHGWWHLMTGIGAYFYLVWGIWLRHCLNNNQDQVELLWPRSWTSFPSVVRRKNTANVSQKKNL